MKPARFLRAVTLAALSCVLGLQVSLLAAPADKKEAAPRQVKHQVTGLFSPDRADDLREAFTRLPEIKLLSIDYDNAEITVEYAAARAFPGAQPGDIVQQFDNKLRSVSYHTFGIKPLRTVPKEKLQLVEIDVVGLDCKGCSLGAYDAIYRLDGVERATASFRAGKVTALIDPTRTDRGKLEAALKQREVQVKPRRAP